MRVAIAEISNVFERIENFYDINFQALRKILKKFDKKIIIPAELSGTVFPLVSTMASFLDQLQETYKSKIIDVRKLIHNMFDTFGKPSKFEFDEASQKELNRVMYEHDIPTLGELALDAFASETIHKFRLKIASDGMHNPITIPVIVAKVFILFAVALF